MISTGDLKRGMTLDMDGDLWTVLEYHHIKIGRGSAQVRLKIRNLKTGTTVERTFQAGEKFRRAIVDRKPVQYLYHDGDTYYFMDTETYEQTIMNASQLGEVIPYLKDQLTLDIMSYQDQAIGAELPANVELKVTQTDPGYRGDTATGGTKPATLETGMTVQVPLFVNEEDLIRVDTRSGQYLERA
ncbi:MAG TPA: elongation factor P [Chloroflexi bacterium]|jgi:elongation factor P|nr:elongation factor P [Chloroflexota bacterium]